MSPLAGWLGYFRWVGKISQRREVHLISFQTRDRGILGVNGATAVYDLVMDGVGVGMGGGDLIILIRGHMEVGRG